MGSVPDDVLVSVEALGEAKIKEIKYDGTEVANVSLTQSEQLSLSASKIDFSEFLPTKQKRKGDTSKPDEAQPPEKKKVSAAQVDQWKSIKQSLRLALVEIGVLTDLIQLSRQKHYMVLDHTGVTQETQDGKMHGAQHYARKKGLLAAGQMLTSASEQLRLGVELRAKSRQGHSDFHSELIKLHQCWRLRTQGPHIIGDLSYKSAGSRFPHHGVFEVMKNDVRAVSRRGGRAGESGEMSGGDGGGDTEGSGGTCSLKVIVPSELEGISCIQVTWQKEGSGSILYEENHSLNQSDMKHLLLTPEAYWNHKLEAAQNVLFCKELFDRLRREARQIKLKTPALVVDNTIICPLTPGVQLSITLNHMTTSDAESKPDPSAPPLPRLEFFHVLETSLHQLLCDSHRQVVDAAPVFPVTGPARASLTRYLGGPQATHRGRLDQDRLDKPLLQQVIEQAKHILLRARTAAYLDSLAKSYKEPSLVIHWNSVNSSTCSIVRLQCIFPFYDSISRATLELKIGVDDIEVRCKDGRTMHVGHESSELKDILQSQIAQHHVMVALAVCRPMSWTVLSNSMTLGCGPMESVGNASSCVLLSPQKNRCIIIRSGVSTGVKVVIKGVSAAEAKHLLPPEVTFKPCADNCLAIDWKQLNMYQTFPQKLEYLMALLAQE